ncbi:MAG: hypothetical protein K2P94_06020 [Rhodospirillaceae bacterium]|nr:hypothetical protein [Rhodospirillaceae bacterium]
MSEPVVFKPIHELSGLIRTGKLSPRELAAACLSHIAAMDAKLGAFADLWAGDAMATAAAHETAIRGGHYLGPLHGIPVAFKDMVEVAGRRVRISLPARAAGVQARRVAVRHSITTH